MRERLNEEIKRRTRVVRIFPNAASCLRVVRALCADTHEGWLEDHRSLNMEFPERTEERTAARRLTDHSLSHESAIAQLDVHNPIEIPRQSCSPTSERSDFAHPGGVRTSRRLGAAPSWPGRRIPQRASADARGDPASGKATCLWRNTTSIRAAVLSCGLISFLSIQRRPCSILDVPSRADGTVARPEPRRPGSIRTCPPSTPGLIPETGVPRSPR